MTSAIRKWGNSAGTLIPARVLAKAGLHIGDAVSLHAQVGEIVIRQAQPEYNLDTLLAATPAKCLQDGVEDQAWLGNASAGKEMI
jgi:antitoxin MazE/antitoxin ChpS